MLENLIHYPIFSDFTDADLAVIASIFRFDTYAQGTAILRQGEKANCLYLLLSGKIDIIYKPYDGKPIKLTSLSAGNAFGWSAVLGSELYSSSVICVSPVDVLKVCGPDLRDLKEKNPRISALIMDRLARSVSTRWSSAQRQVASMINQSL